MYFDKFKTVEDVKSRFKVLAKRLHPDVGGDTVIMQEINIEYQLALTKLEKENEFSGFDNSENIYVSSDRKKIEKVFAWAENNPSFDQTFTYNLLKWIDSGKELTYSQKCALNNIIKKFKIDM